VELGHGGATEVCSAGAADHPPYATNSGIAPFDECTDSYNYEPITTELECRGMLGYHMPNGKFRGTSALHAHWPPGCFSWRNGVYLGTNPSGTGITTHPMVCKRKGTCGVNEKVVNHICTVCPAGAINTPTDASGPDTTCNYPSNVVFWDGPISGSLIASPGTIGIRPNVPFGWGKTASSLRSITASDSVNGISFQVSLDLRNSVIGLTSTTNFATYRDFDFAIQYLDRHLDVYEKGVKKATWHGHHSSTDTFSIELSSNNLMEFKRNGVTIYGSTRTVVYPWRVAFDDYNSPAATMNSVVYLPKPAP